MNAVPVQMIAVTFRGRREVLTYHEAEELRLKLSQAVCFNAVDSDRIKLEVCGEFGLRLDELLSDARPERISFPRQVAMWLHRSLTDLSLNEIGMKFPRSSGKARDHGTVLHAKRAVENRMVDAKLWARLMKLHKKVEQAIK